MCIHAMVPDLERPPFQMRRGVATVRPREVDRRGKLTLLCDCLHNGPHEWPMALAPIEVDRDGIERALASNRVDEGEEFVE